MRWAGHGKDDKYMGYNIFVANSEKKNPVKDH
jgi:hypothetical protein